MRHEAIRLVYSNAGVINGESEVWDQEGNSISIDESKVSAKLAELQAAYDAQAYARKREAEYPSIQELVVALYDTDDKSAIEAKRAAVKAKYPKG